MRRRHTGATLVVRLAAIVVGLGTLGAVAACSLPVDERVTRIDQGDVPDDLTEVTTTTTTTTTTSTTVPMPTAPDDTTVGPATTTTVPVIPVEIVTVFYTRGITDVMQPVEVQRPVNTPVQELIPLLERPSGISPLSTSLLPGLVDDIVVERGTATVILDPDVLDRMTTSNQQRAIAQIVLTVTSFRTSDAGAIGRVRFEVEGEGFPVYVPAFGGSSEPGEELAYTDFQMLIANTPTPSTVSEPPTTTITTTITTTTTTTTVPADHADDEAGGDQ